MPSVSVIMPVYNGERYLAEAIESILAQTFTDFELIIVDDGSRDRTAAIIRDFEKRDARVRPLRHEANRGHADARNTGIAAAAGEYITCMDSDDVSLPERLEQQLRFLEANPDISGLGVGCLYVDENLKRLRDCHLPERHALIAFNHFLGVPLIFATVMLRREVLTALGGFQPGLNYAYDSELESRLFQSTRFKLANLPDMLYLYRQHQQPGLTDAKTRHNRRDARRELKRRSLEKLWGGPPPEGTIERFERLLPFRKLNWRERRLAKRDCKRLIDAMIARNWIDPADKSLLIAEMNRLLERASPRLWQMFCHWRRHHFGR